MIENAGLYLMLTSNLIGTGVLIGTVVTMLRTHAKDHRVHYETASEHETRISRIEGWLQTKEKGA